eukprot:556926-Amphidinium_carterae.1
MSTEVCKLSFNLTSAYMWKDMGKDADSISADVADLGAGCEVWASKFQGPLALHRNATHLTSYCCCKPSCKSVSLAANGRCAPYRDLVLEGAKVQTPPSSK